MSENPYTKKAPDLYEEYTQAEKGSICPFIGVECVKDPQKCRFWQPFLIMRETVLHTMEREDIYMCAVDALRVSLNNALLMLQGQQAIFQYAAQAQGMTGQQQNG